MTKEKIITDNFTPVKNTTRISQTFKELRSKPRTVDAIDTIVKRGKKITTFKDSNATVKIDSSEDSDNPTITIDIEHDPKVYVIQEIAGTRMGAPKINIMGARKYGEFVFCLPEMSQIIFSPGPLIFRLRDKLRSYSPHDYLLLTGDPAIIGVACSIVSDITNGKYKLLKWDKQERKYYPIEINLHEKGNKDE